MTESHKNWYNLVIKAISLLSTPINQFSIFLRLQIPHIPELCSSIFGRQCINLRMEKKKIVALNSSQNGEMWNLCPLNSVFPEILAP
jgi:hypothetical protein